MLNMATRHNEKYSGTIFGLRISLLSMVSGEIARTAAAEIREPRVRVVFMASCLAAFHDYSIQEPHIAQPSFHTFSATNNFCTRATGQFRGIVSRITMYGLTCEAS